MDETIDQLGHQMRIHPDEFDRESICEEFLLNLDS
jgi:hypothetical protein